MTMRHTLPAIVMAIVFAGAAPAAEWHFDPVLTVFTEYNDNINLTDSQVDDSSGDADESDQITTGVVRLPLTARTPRTTFGLTYEPRYEKYHDPAHSEFDNSEHYVSARWFHQASPRWDWSLTGSWARRDRQRPSFDEPNIDLVIVPRTRSTTVNGSFGLGWAISPRHRFTLTPECSFRAPTMSVRLASSPSLPPSTRRLRRRLSLWRCRHQPVISANSSPPRRQHWLKRRSTLWRTT